MLNYFFEQGTIEEIDVIKKQLNEKKAKLMTLNFSEPYSEYENANHLFDKVKEKAIINKDEMMANASFIAKVYFRLFCDLASYFQMLQDNKLEDSWIKLQDCFDDIYGIGRFVEFDKRLEISSLNKLLKEYEKLYPYRVFASSEYIIEESECSICGKPMNSFECSHIKGELYWGEIAYERVSKIKEVNAVAIVTNPVDKRCVMQIADDNRSEDERFLLLREFLKQKIYNFQHFTIVDNKVLKRDNSIKKQPANQLCSCGSGKKFKNCCKDKMYYEHHNYKINLGEKIYFYDL